MPVAGDGRCHIRSRWYAEPQRRAWGTRLPEGWSRKINDPPTLLLMSDFKPFPCQPVGFWPLPGYSDDESVLAAKKRYHEVYFAEYEGVWCEPPFTFNLLISAPRGTDIFLHVYRNVSGLVYLPVTTAIPIAYQFLSRIRCLGP